MHRILIMDAALSVFESAQQSMLGKWPGATFVAASSHSQCIHGLDENFDAIMIDDHSPSNLSDTTQIVQQIRMRCPQLPIMVLLDPGNEHKFAQLSREGANDFVVKSSAFAAILPHRLHQILRSSQLQKELSEEKSETQRLVNARDRKQKFLRALVHELRTPLVSLRVYAQFLSSGRMGSLTAQQHEKILAIYRNCERLIHCIESIQRYDRLECPRLDIICGEFDLKELLNEAIALVARPCMEKGISVAQSWPLGPVHVVGDRDMLLQVMNIILENAIDHTDSKGGISVALNSENSENVTVSIADSGSGIAPDVLKHVSEFTWNLDHDKIHGGCLGLGLPLAKRILEAHGSSFEIDSQPGTGTRVRFALSRVAYHKKPAATGISVRQEVPDPRENTVLVVDDEEDNLVCMRGILESAGYEVRSAGGLDEAREQLHEEPIDAILMDIAMKDSDGLVALKNLKHCPETSSIPVVMVSARADDAVRIQALRMGAAGFIVKPFVPTKLLKEVACAISEPEAIGLSAQ